MDIDFGALIVDLETLADSSKEDFSNEYWHSYEDYVNKYNSILSDLKTLGFFKKQKPIEEVPFSDQSFSGSEVTRKEKAKLREVANSASSLLKKVRLLLAPPKTINSKQGEIRSSQVFVVGGQNKEMNKEVIQTLQKLELDPIVLDDQQNKAKTVIQNIADYPQVSFAVVLVSPDCLEYSKEHPADTAKPVPDQNTVFGLGYFLGYLGKNNVAAIYKKTSDFKIPDNIDGVLWIEYKNGWYFKLINQLKENNYDVDANKLGWI